MNALAKQVVGGNDSIHSESRIFTVNPVPRRF
jgi:hypothetical protein